MQNPSTAAEAAFLAIVLVVAALLAYALRKALHAQGVRGTPGLMAAILVFWLLVPAVLAKMGILSRFSPPPAPGFLVIGLVTLGTVVLAFSPVGARLVAALPLAGIVGYQLFRVPLELVLHQLYAEGVIPVQMTYTGLNYDIVTGALAGALGAWLWTGRRAAAWLVAAWNVLGLALLANIVVISVLSSPVPFRTFMNEPANLLLTTFPYVWLPTFLVQAALFGHLLVFRALRPPTPTPAPSPRGAAGTLRPSA